MIDSLIEKIKKTGAPIVVGLDPMLGYIPEQIKKAAFVMTDSFHCVVMCLKFHKPFVAITEQKGNVGMNDRLYTLLERVGLSDNIVYKGQLKDIESFSEVSVNWSQADSILSEFHKSVDCLFK